MPLHHAVLALLASKPAHGYELKRSFEQAVGDQWGGLNIGRLYQILDRLSDAILAQWLTTLRAIGTATTC
jgi:DNA-binding PadR family transcriptional regulator